MWERKVMYCECLMEGEWGEFVAYCDFLNGVGKMNTK